MVSINYVVCFSKWTLRLGTPQFEVGGFACRLPLSPKTQAIEMIRRLRYSSKHHDHMAAKYFSGCT